MPTVQIQSLVKRFGKEVAVAGIDLSIEKGEFVTLLGPSGCGKTTTLRCIAGLEHPDEGEISISGELITSVEKDIFLNPEDRNLGMVFQSYAVWPHMTVFDNVAFGLKIRGVSRNEIKDKTDRALELVGLSNVADRYTTKLSGGQRQRVALARAIVYRPEVILFDEPLSNLDAKLREQMRIELVRLQQEVGITSIYVTHDQTEALVMSDRVVVMDKGIIQQIDNPERIYANPKNSFVANFIGVANLIEGEFLSNAGEFADGKFLFGKENVFFNLRAFRLFSDAPPEGTTNILEGEIVDTVYQGNLLDCQVKIGNNEIAVQMNHFEKLITGQKVFISFSPEHALFLAE